MRGKIPNLIGQTFGRWEVIAKAKPDKKHNSCWKCKCQCGIKRKVKTKNLLNGQSKSCGCYNIDQKRHSHTTHGLFGTDRWQLWHSAGTRARKKHIPFTITPSDIPEIPLMCPILNIVLKRGQGIGGMLPSSPSLDRIIPIKGYIPGNIQVISQRANQIKTDATPEEVMKVALWMRGADSPPA